MLTSLHTKLATETHLAEAQVSQVTEKKGGAPEITRKNTSNIQKRRASFHTWINTNTGVLVSP